nr:MAG TPA: HEPN/RES N-terminal domain 1 [Caudoviricetes sp.]
MRSSNPFGTCAYCGRQSNQRQVRRIRLHITLCHLHLERKT